MEFVYFCEKFIYIYVKTANIVSEDSKQCTMCEGEPHSYSSEVSEITGACSLHTIIRLEIRKYKQHTNCFWMEKVF